RVDDQLVAVVEDHHDQLQESTGMVGADRQPPAWIILIVEWTRVKNMGAANNTASSVSRSRR
ncbi:hypothetical protein, partial [Candidatus Corynebacterium faecigallinarum]|uniref:hypothetical protein n=1 Tax=Candidatus Corynebacterium faecigallinarum TaxID=2838528 RepID=UPI003FD45B0F